MLVLQRRADQAIMIGDDIEIVVLAVSGDHVKIGIRAPRTLRIVRSELLRDVEQENQRAVASGSIAPGAISAALRQGRSG
jgi:carbon storage regulator